MRFGVRGAGCWVVLALLACAAQAGWAQVRMGPTPITPPAIPVPPPPAVRLPDPPAAQIPAIIQKFAANEAMSRQLLKHSYTYTESINMQLVDEDGNPIGQSYEQTNDINFTPDGQRQITCTWCPQPTLRDVLVTEEDIDDFFNMDMYAVAIQNLADYDIKYLDHEKLDELTAYRFSVRPKQIKKGQRYFAGTIWVDDHYLQVVKSEGKAVPDEFDKHGQPTNTFLPFTTYRQLIDKQHWFPVYTSTDAMLGDSHVKLVIQFKNYKRFGSSVRIIPIAK